MSDALASETSMTNLVNPVQLGKDYYYPYSDAVVPFAYKLVQPTRLSSSRSSASTLAMSSSSSSTTGTLVTLGAQLSAAVTKLFPALANSLQQSGKLGTAPASLSALVFPIHPEVPEMLSLYQLIGWVQYLLRRRSSPSSSTSSALNSSVPNSSVPTSSWWQRIYLGSPHLFYRSQNKSTAPSALTEDYQLLDREPIYPSGTWSTADLEPLHDDFRLNTMLIWRAPAPSASIVSRTLQSFPQSPLSPINLLPQYSARQSGTYCGDNRGNWQLAYEVGKAGTFDTCRELYLAQTNIAPSGINTNNQTGSTVPLSETNRTFQATITLPIQFFQSLPQQSQQSQSPQLSTTPIIPQTISRPQSFIGEQRHQPQNDDGGQGAENADENKSGDEVADIENVVDDERKTLQLDTDAMRWQAGKVGSSLAQAREDYRNAERELLRLQLTPFLRPSVSLPQPPATSIFLPAVGSSLRSS